MRLPDVSEFQSNVDAPSYLRAGYSCIIARAHNGWRVDRLWPARRDYLRRFPFAAIGFYQYLVAGRPAADQARDFISTVGALRPNEFVILDHEEGNGSQTTRAEAWFSVVDARYGRPSTLYAGQFFGRDQLGGWAHWRRPRWIAAYQGTPPSDPHELWQNTDRFPFPGIGVCDGSIFNGSPQQFAQTFAHHTPLHAAPQIHIPPPGGREDVIAAVVKQNGAIEVFYEAQDGEVLHAWQTGPNQSWAGAEKGKRRASWESLGNPQKTKA